MKSAAWLRRLGRMARQHRRRKKHFRSRAVRWNPHFESLEDRRLLSADLAWDVSETALWTQNGVPGDAAVTTHAQTLIAEGELSAAPDLVAFAKALADAGVIMYGAAWCPFCTQQKQMFDVGSQFVPMIEATNPDRTLNEIAIDNNIEVLPTWDFPDGSRAEGVLSLQELSELSGVAIPQSVQPFFVEIPDATVPLGSPLHLPINAYDPNGLPLTITATTADPGIVEAVVTEGNRSLRVTVAGFGDMVFELFEQRAPRPTERVVELTEMGFYDAQNNDPPIPIHRVIENFVIQFGDPTGTGAGGSDLGFFDDQYHPELQHNRTGVLSFAKAGDDTNDSQLFVTAGPQRMLDFNHSIVGQLIEGEEVRAAISRMETDASDRPTTPIQLESFEIFEDDRNGLVMLRPTGTTGQTSVTVTVTNSEGESFSQTLPVTVVEDTFNSPPFLDEIGEITTVMNQDAEFQLSAFDVEGDPFFFDAAHVGDVDYEFEIDNETGLVRVTPPTDFVGTMEILVAVRQVIPADTVNQFDTQVVPIHVLPPDEPASPDPPSSVELLASSDTGFDDSDGITNATELTFRVLGVLEGAVVELKADGTVVGQATASGESVEITTTEIAELGDGTYSITAVQSVDGLQSASSPAMTLVFDTTPPPEFTSQPPTLAHVGRLLEYNAENPEEGEIGFQYSLSGPPEGVSIDAASGLLSWTPTPEQIGNHQFEILATDAAGNSRAQPMDITVADEILVEFRLEVTDLDGQPVSHVFVGDEFLLRVFVGDQREGDEALGVFAAFLDVFIQNELAVPVDLDPITISPQFPVAQSGDTDTPGLINELGGAADSLTPFGPDERFLAEVRLLALETGTEMFVGDPSDVSPDHDTLLFGMDTPVDRDRILHGATSVEIVANFVLNDDIFNFDEGTSDHVLNVLENDVFPAGVVPEIIEVSAPSHGGTVTISEDGQSLVYSPDPTFRGEETFTYTVTDHAGSTGSANVTVQLHPVNKPPAAQDDEFTVEQNSQNNLLDVLANDSTENIGKKLRVDAVGPLSAGGSVVIGPNGTHLLYTPNPGFTGTETFTYTLGDGSGLTDEATVSVTVSATANVPLAADDQFTVAMDADEAFYDVLANDQPGEPDGILTVVSVGTPTEGGFASIAEGGAGIRYQPASGFVGTETVVYTIDDGSGNTASALVTFHVVAETLAVDDTFSVPKGASNFVLDVLANDILPPHVADQVQIVAVSEPSAGGQVQIAADGRSLRYTPASGEFTGTETFTYTIDDGSETHTANVTVNVVEFVPRTIRGVVTNGATGHVFGGVTVTLTGTDLSGSEIDLSTTTNAHGQFEFPDLPPGEYRLSKPHLAFLLESENEVLVQSGENDESHEQDLMQRGRQASTISLMDFLGSRPRHSITATVAVGGEHQWYQVTGNGWEDVSQMSLALSQDGSSLTLTIVENGIQRSTTLDVNGSAVRMMEGEDDLRLVEIYGGRADFSFQTSTGAQAAGTQAGTGEGEPSSAAPASSNSSDGLPPAEGEFAGQSVALPPQLGSIPAAPQQLVMSGMEPPLAEPPLTITSGSADSNSVASYSTATRLPASSSIESSGGAPGVLQMLTGTQTAARQQVDFPAHGDASAVPVSSNAASIDLAMAAEAFQGDWRLDLMDPPGERPSHDPAHDVDHLLEEDQWWDLFG